MALSAAGTRGGRKVGRLAFSTRMSKLLFSASQRDEFPSHNTCQKRMTSDAGKNEMRVPFGTRKGIATVNWFHANPALSNQHCLYCSRFVGAGSELESDKEHLINRRIAAPGLLGGANAFNFIFRACKPCNEEKARLEEHISAVTLLTSPGREDPLIDAAARAKGASSFDRRHRRAVAEVRNQFRIRMGPFTFGLTSAAQLDPNAVRVLAFRHVQGIFSLVASRDPRRTETTKVLSGHEFGFFASYPYRDWGNPQLLEIVRRVDGYERVADITTADGFFRASLRPGPDGEPWFWALEWNQNLRVVGWIGDPETPPEPFNDLPTVAWHQLDANNRVRHEIPLPDDAEDLMFLPVE